MLIKDNLVPDIVDQIGREVSFQLQNGRRPRTIRISPEVHEVLRQQARVSRGSVLLTHDPEVAGCPPLPVTVDTKFIGPTAYIIGYDGPAPVTEEQHDRLRAAG